MNRKVINIMEKDYYKILNLPPTCQKADITQSYRYLAKKWHPDKCSDPDSESKFQDILKAHDILSDPVKKSIYDKQFEKGIKKPAELRAGAPVQVYRQVNSINNFPLDAQKIFQQFFAADGTLNKSNMWGSSPFSVTRTYTSSTSGTVPPSHNKQSVIKTLQCSLEDMYLGVIKLVKITTNTNGIDENKLLKVVIPKGCSEGREIIITDAKVMQDVVFVVNSKPHHSFTRIGDDLHINHIVNIQDYINGFTVTVPSLDKSPIRQINHKYGGYLLEGKLPEYTIPKMGMPIFNTMEYGSLVLHISIKLPSSI